MVKFILCFHYIGSLFGPLRNDPSHSAVLWKQKCCWIDPTRFLFSFGAIRWDNKDCLHVIHINFPIKSIDSCWMLKRGQHEIYRKIYWITKYSKKVRLEKKIKQKIFLLTEENLNVRKKFSRISVDWRWNPATAGSHSKLEGWRRLQEDYKILHSVVFRFIKNFNFFFKHYQIFIEKTFH